ncbi:SSI family serine proteinase inhibitor [Motilibacter aurantiacus]|uniref:SSI family serine proteinase inhibitor n=1 Tax=Motilibacter aurantiacus TaxID=2714955 RepID=UPI00140A5ADD|nr:SSI family serine proteinase inhibitor [Motilibacter aurantiacus]NHC46386.1 hypothetical protein [Motilibacter aurantiacus]
MRTAAIAAAALLALAGCGGEDDAGTPTSAVPTASAGVGTPEPGTPATDPAGAPTRLQVTVDLAANMAYDWTLTCDPPGGDHPRAADACAALAAYGLEQLPLPDQVCTEQFGGPETARVQGTLDGKPVDVSLDRTDGCRIAQWGRLRPLLQPTT